MSAHTPGPWRTFDTAYGAVHIVKRASDAHLADIVVINTERNQNAAADAALIAAAPDLLAECKADDSLALFIESALKSARVPSGHPDISRAFADIRGALTHRHAARRAAIAKAEGAA